MKLNPKAMAFWLAAVEAMAASTGFGGSGPVFLNNFDANSFIGCPLYYGYFDYQSQTTFGPYLLPNDGKTFVQIYVNDYALLPGAGRAIVEEPGFFDFGIVDTGVPDNAAAVFRLQFWRGDVDDTYANATYRDTHYWVQNVGSYPTGVPPLPPLPATLTFGGASSVGIFLIPEPTTVPLGILGALALFARRRFK